MLQQMMVEDKCDQVRSVCSKSLAMVINEIDDESRLSPVKFHLDFWSFFFKFLFKCIELLDRCLSDTSDVVQSAKRYLLPSIAIWCLELNKICYVLIEHYSIKLESLVQVRWFYSIRFLNFRIFFSRISKVRYPLITNVLFNWFIS